MAHDPAPAASITVLYFAALRDLVGLREEQLALPREGRTRVLDVLELLQGIHPQLVGRLGAVRVAVDETFADSSDPVSPGSVLALLPPVQGG